MRSRSIRSVAKVSVGSLLAGVALVGLPQSASANGQEIPENGTEIMGRAGAWTARADNPMAAALNPAGLAGQPTALLVNANLTWQKYCFQRTGNYASSGLDNGKTIFQGQDYSGQPYPEVCKDNKVGDVNVVPQLAFNYHVNDKLGIAFAIVTPSGAGKAKWPDQVTINGDNLAPAPQRYMLLEQNGVVIQPTLAVGYEVAKGIRLGVAFQATMAFLKFANTSRATNSPPGDPAESPNGDLRADLTVKKLFTPGIILGALFSPTDELDIGAMFKWSADIHSSSADVKVTGPYYGTSQDAASTPAVSTGTGEFRAAIPWEIRTGVRWHPTRKDGKVAPSGKRHDFLATDLFDLELDLTYAHNSSFDTLDITFAGGQCIAFGSNPCPNKLPPDTSIPHKWRDTFGARLGGEFVAVPERLGIRAGAFVQGNGQDPDYAALDFLPSSMFGFYLGGTLRLSKVVDVALGFGHVFLHGLNNGPNGQVHGIAATTGTCADGTPTPAYRGCNVVNSGKFSGGYNMASLGATFKF